MKVRSWVCAALAAWPALAHAQQRDESSMFGGDETAADAGRERIPEDAMFGGDAPMAAEADGGTSRDGEQLSGPEGKNQFDEGSASADPLQIGGTLYMRYQANFAVDQPIEKSGFAAPSLLDVFLDARPSERIRAFALGRLRYDPSVSSSGAVSPLPGLVPSGGSNPSVALDQLWVRFDVARSVFFTIGRQKVKWGVGRLWNPTDFLNAQRRDPLAPFDLRLGINAVKVHVPIEALGWNFYGFGLLDNNGPAGTLGELGGALRAEILVGPAEVSFSGAWVNGRRPRYAIDMSTPIGPLDVYAEVAFRDGRDFTQFRERTDADPPAAPGDFKAAFPEYRFEGLQVPTTVGAAFSLNYTDSSTLVMGAEYFYNPTGAPKAALHIPALLSGTFTPFYAGQHYLGVFVLAPGAFDTQWMTLSLNNLVNLSDPSGIVRLDAFLRVMSFLQIELFVSVNYGLGEFRLGGSVDLPTGRETIPLPVASTGVGLRVSI